LKKKNPLTTKITKELRKGHEVIIAALWEFGSKLIVLCGNLAHFAVKKKFNPS